MVMFFGHNSTYTYRGFPYKAIEWCSIVQKPLMWLKKCTKAFDLSLQWTKIPLYSKFLGKPMTYMHVIAHLNVYCRSYAVDGYKKEFWSVFRSYMEEASCVAGEQVHVHVCV